MGVMAAYYNEIDSFAADWLRSLIAAGLIMDGEVDDRDIRDVEGSDLVGFDRCHFFAGIGGWDYALQLAGWDGPVWTGSCPCQPFSSAGKGKGADDERHLWPEFARLIRECKPATVFGEQVASKAGREWFDGVSTDLEDMGYAAAAADLCAAGVNAPHVRQRLFWVAEEHSGEYECEDCGEWTVEMFADIPVESCCWCQSSRLVDPRSQRRCERPAGIRDAGDVSRPGQDVWGGEYRGCADGKSRRVSSGVPLLGHGIPGRVELMRGYGNAIVPQVGAEFIGSYLDACSGSGAA